MDDDEIFPTGNTFEKEFSLVMRSVAAAGVGEGSWRP